MTANAANRSASAFRHFYYVSYAVGRFVCGLVGHEMPENYARVPDSVADDPEISPDDERVYRVLSRRVYQGTIAQIGIRRIAKLARLHKDTVAASLRKLRERGHIEVRGEGNARRLYHLRSDLFGQKQAAGVEEVVSFPRARLTSVRKDTRSA